MTSSSKRACGAFAILTWKRASRHIGMHFSNISTSKSALTMVCFAHFDLETRFAPQQSALFQHLKLQKWSGHVVLLAFDFKMCFAPQRCVLFEYVNFQKCSEAEVLLTFSLPHVLRATAACNFSSLIRPYMAPHPPLYRAYFSTLRSHRTL